MARPRLALGTVLITKRCAWCGGRVDVLKSEAAHRAYCSTYCYKARALEDERRHREKFMHDADRGVPVHAVHPEMMRYLDDAQRARPSYERWRAER